MKNMQLKPPKQDAVGIVARACLRIDSKGNKRKALFLNLPWLQGRRAG